MPPPHRPTAARRADAAANRAAVLRVAGELYAARGLEVSFEELAQAADVGRATVYRHFPTREALHGALRERIVEQIEAVADGPPPTPATFLRLFNAVLRVQVDNLPLVDLLPRHGTADDAMRGLRARVTAVFRAPLAVAQQAGRVRADLTPEDVRIQLLMLSAVSRPETPKADRLRAQRLVRVAFGASPR